MNRSEFIRLLEKYTRIEKREDMFELTIEDEIISDVDFSSFYLGGSYFGVNQFDSCTFHTTRLTHTDFSCNIFRNCTFSENYILKANWNYLKLIHCFIVSIEALKVSFLNIVMEDCEVKGSEFTQCLFQPLHTEGTEEGHFSKTIFRNCTFELCNFEDCAFDSVKFIGCTFFNTKIDTKNPRRTFYRLRVQNNSI